MSTGPGTADTPPMFPVDQIDGHFPKPHYREGQREAIEFACNSFNSGKDFVILEAPTGSGKSPIAFTMASMVQNCYYLTVTKILQDQLVGDFGHAMVELKGRNSYPCTYYERYGPSMVANSTMAQQHLDQLLQSRPNCAEGFCRTDCPPQLQMTKHKCVRCFKRPQVVDPEDNRKQGVLTALPPGMSYSACPYFEQVAKATAADMVTMNFSSFLYQTQMTNRFELPRDLLVCDEAHSLEQDLLEFVTMTIDDRELRKLGITLPAYESALEYAVWFLEHNLEIALKGRMSELSNQLRDSQDPLQQKQIVKDVDDLSRTMYKFRQFMQNMERDDRCEWVTEVADHKVAGREWRRVTLKPVQVHQFTNSLVFRHGRKVLLMSATILNVDVLCRSLGISRERVATYRMRNRFPVANRPIYVESIGNVRGGRSNMAQWGPAMVAKVNELVDRYPGQRGIIHTHNFAISDLLMSDCAPQVRSRFLYQRQFHDKLDMLDHHATRQDTMIVAPAMHEGINLFGDLSRLQIICKIPYPNHHEDRQLARRMELDDDYYNYLTALKLAQQYGRSVRSEQDWAHTYIIDGGLQNFLNRAHWMLPEWFLEAIQWR